MNTDHLQRQFTKMGARLKVVHRHTRGSRQPDYALDVRQDGDGEFFELRLHPEPASHPDVLVLQTEAKDRHLVLMAKLGPRKDRFLCGHDEREWFVAAVPGNASTVFQAKEALKPAEVRIAQSRAGLNGRQRQKRRNDAFIRQGEWFFLPVSGPLVVDPRDILRHEPIRRGGGKPHLIDEVVRSGGEAVHVCPQCPNGLTEEQRNALVCRRPAAAKWAWRVMRRNAAVYARGQVRHPDHRTITLHGWHRVLMNTESETPTMQNVAFLD